MCSGYGHSSGDTARISTFGNRLFDAAFDPPASAPRKGHHHTEVAGPSGSEASRRGPRAPQKPCHWDRRDARGRETAGPSPAGSSLASEARGPASGPGRSPPPHKQEAGPAARVTRTPPCTSPAPAQPARNGGRASPAQAQEAATARAARRPPLPREGELRAEAGKGERLREPRGGSRVSAAAAAPRARAGGAA